MKCDSCNSEGYYMSGSEPICTGTWFLIMHFILCGNSWHCYIAACGCHTGGTNGNSGNCGNDGQCGKYLVVW